MKYKKREQRAAAQQGRQPLYHKGMRTDDPNYVRNPVFSAEKKGKSRPPMDPRYPPARYATPQSYAYKGPVVVLPAHDAPLIAQPPRKKTFTEEWPTWWIWLIVAAIIISICVALIVVILYVFGEITGESPVYKGLFG